jgi:hypothetical protein
MSLTGARSLLAAGPERIQGDETLHPSSLTAHRGERVWSNFYFSADTISLVIVFVSLGRKGEEPFLEMRLDSTCCEGRVAMAGLGA